MQVNINNEKRHRSDTTTKNDLEFNIKILFQLGKNRDHKNTIKRFSSETKEENQVKSLETKAEDVGGGIEGTIFISKDLELGRFPNLSTYSQQHTLMFSLFAYYLLLDPSAI